MNILKELLANESGASAIEYALIAALVSIAAISAMKNLGTNVNTKFEKVADETK
jgi:pilus assembly protein Flp/PilA